MSQRFESLAMAQMALMKKKPIKPSQSAWKRIAAKVCVLHHTVMEKVVGTICAIYFYQPMLK